MATRVHQWLAHPQTQRSPSLSLALDLWKIYGSSSFHLTWPWGPCLPRFLSTPLSPVSLTCLSSAFSSSWLLSLLSPRNQTWGIFHFWAFLCLLHYQVLWLQAPSLCCHLPRGYSYADIFPELFLPDALPHISKWQF